MASVDTIASPAPLPLTIERHLYTFMLVSIISRASLLWLLLRIRTGGVWRRAVRGVLCSRRIWASLSRRGLFEGFPAGLVYAGVSYHAYPYEFEALAEVRFVGELYRVGRGEYPERRVVRYVASGEEALDFEQLFVCVVGASEHYEVDGASRRCEQVFFGFEFSVGDDVFGRRDFLPPNAASIVGASGVMPTMWYIATEPLVAASAPK